MGSLKLAVPCFCIACLLLLNLPVYSQPGPLITLTERNVSLQKALDDIHQKTGYTYFGESNWTDYVHRVSFSVRKASLRQVLDSCFKDQPYTYELIGTAIAVQPRPKKAMVVHGFVYTEKNEPLENVTILVKGEMGVAALTRANGEFTIAMRYEDDRLLISSVNYDPVELAPIEGRDMVIQLKERVGELVDVVVTHNGYRDQNKKNTTGSFEVLNSDLLDRRVSTNVLDRIDGITNSVLFNKNPVVGVNQSAITIRGRSTIFANPNPLIVIDNFPFFGDLNSINPEDVESVTVLKDAAAASIWGAYSGNGVIVLTTKKGKLNQEPKLTFMTSQTVGAKPDLFYQPVMSSADYIDVEQFLYRKGFYNTLLAPLSNTVIYPAVDVFDKTSKGLLSSADSASLINAMKGQDVRNDLKKYFYRPSVNSQYLVSLNGGGLVDQYYFSAGFDRNMSNQVRNEYDRISLMGNNTYLFVPDKLELTTGLAFTTSKTYSNNTGGVNSSYPYAQLADASGNALPVSFRWRNSYIDTAGGGQLLDWHYRPLDELRYSDNTARMTDYRINVGFRYMIRKGLEAKVNYQYGHGDSIANNYQSLQTFYTRDLINTFTQLNNGIPIFNIPKGGILDGNNNTYTTNYGRLQLSYNDSIFKRGKLNVLGGLEIRDIATARRTDRLYGYNKEDGNSVGVDYTHNFPQYANLGQPALIPYMDLLTNFSERYLSYYASGDYIYAGRYIISASARRDESNLFGVKANQKGVSLWSAGAAWLISRENFYHLSWLPELKLRVTDGFNGNVDRTVSAYTSANFNQGANSYGNPSLMITNPANPSLQWERTNILNMGLDFSLPQKRFGGSLEYYLKAGSNLIGYAPLDPTTGLSSFKGNTADMRAHGLDVSLQADNPIGAVRWNSVLLFSFVRDRITDYKQNIGSVSSYLNPTYISPLVGKPLYSIYALRWAGLSSQAGDPQGVQGGHISTNYSGIINSPNLNDMVYMGPASPPFFGSWRNSFYWKNLSFSFNVLFKMGYVFRRSSINYYALYNGDKGNRDYDKRWQKPGDEKITNVPSMRYPLSDNNRDLFYQNSVVLVEKGDHIRLQDIQLSYDLKKKANSWLPVRAMRFYAYANNIGIIWKANHYGIDPDYVQGIPAPRTLAVGLKIEP